MNPHSLIHATNRNPTGSEPPVKVRRSFSWRIKPYEYQVLKDIRDGYNLQTYGNISLARTWGSNLHK